MNFAQVFHTPYGSTFDNPDPWYRLSGARCAYCQRMNVSCHATCDGCGAPTEAAQLPPLIAVHRNPHLDDDFVWEPNKIIRAHRGMDEGEILMVAPLREPGKVSAVKIRDVGA